MERFYYRSTSVTDLQAELRQRELLAGTMAERSEVMRPARRRSFPGLPVFRRPRRHD